MPIFLGSGFGAVVFGMMFFSVIALDFLAWQGFGDWLAKWSTKNLGQSHGFVDGSAAVVANCCGLFRLSVETRQSDSANDKLKSRHCRLMRC